MMARTGRRTRVVVAGLVLGLSAGCAQLPTSGPVNAGRTDAPAAGAVQLDASRPNPGDTPVEVVQGFIAAGAPGASADAGFEVARSFLTEAANSTWKPLAEVVVTANDESAEFQPRLPEDDAAASDVPDAPASVAAEPGTDLDLDSLDRIVVDVDVVAVGDVDETGVFTAASSRAPSEVTYELERVDGEWRIATLPDGLMMSEVQFGLAFQSVALQFLTPDAATFVPDVRYVPVWNAASYAVEHLLTGPVPWLAPGVRTMVPTGLSVEAGRGVITAEAGTVDVYLASTTASTSQLDLVHAQVSQTLTGLFGVNTVRVWFGGAPYEPSGSTQVPLPAVVPDVLVAMSDGEVVTVSGSTLKPYVTDPAAAPEPTADEEPTPVPDPEQPPAEPAELTDPVPGYDPDEPVVALAGDTLVSIARDGTQTPLWTGDGALPPSRDNAGWIWTGDGVGNLVAARTDATVVEIAADFLAASLVTQVRISRDGTRAAIIHEDEQGGWVSLAAVVRDEDGTPRALAEGPRVAGFAVGFGVVWTDATTLAVLAASEEGVNPSVRLVTVTGPSTTIAATSQAVSIAAGAGPSNLYLATVDERLLGRVSLRWEEVAVPVSDPAFAG